MSRREAKSAKRGRRPLEVGEMSVDPGHGVRSSLQVARLPGQGELELPVAVFHGASPGPTIWLSGAVHGDELNGMEVVRRVVANLDARKLAGSVIAVPVVNVFGLFGKSRYTPDRRDLNRSFPGSTKGTLSARLAALFMREIVARCDMGIDLHTGGDSRTNVPQIRCDLSHRKQRRLARAFGAPLVLHKLPVRGTLRHAALARGVPVLLYEGGEPHRFEPTAVRAGVRGIRRVMEELGMYDWNAPEAATRPTEYWNSRWVRAPRAGIYRSRAKIGSDVVAGQPLGSVSGTFGEDEVTVRAPFDGCIIGGAVAPIVHQGDALLHVASRERRR